MDLTPDVEKRIAFEAALDQALVLLLFDAAHDDVDVPDQIRASAKPKEGGPPVATGLNYSRRFHMPDFKVTDLGVQATLTFKGRPFKTFVPWAACLGLVQGKTVLERWVIQAELAHIQAKEPQWKAADFGLDEPVDALQDVDMDKWFTGTVVEG